MGLQSHLMEAGQDVAAREVLHLLAGLHQQATVGHLHLITRHTRPVSPFIQEQR
jgi:hypothetical protein